MVRRAVSPGVVHMLFELCLRAYWRRRDMRLVMGSPAAYFETGERHEDQKEAIAIYEECFDGKFEEVAAII